MSKYIAKVKVGDSTPELNGYRNGDVLDIVPNTGQFFGKNVHKNFLLLEVDDKIDVAPVFKNPRTIYNKETWVYEYSDDGLLSTSNYRVDIDNLLKSRVNDIYNKDFSLDPIKIDNLSGVVKHNIDDPRSPDTKYIPGTIYSGNYDIAGGANHYASVYEFLVDIGNMTGDITGTVKGDTSEGSDAICTFQLNGHTLKVTVDPSGRHDGYAQDSDYIQTLATNGTQLAYLSFANTGTVEFEYLRTVLGSGVSLNNVIRAYSTGYGVVKAHHGLFDNNAGSDTCFNMYSTYNDPCYIYSNIFYGGFLYAVTGAPAGSVWENNSVTGCAISFSANSNAFTLRNNCTFNNTNANHYYLVGSATGYNNMDYGTTCEDGDFATGSGNVTGVTGANEFESFDPTSPDFFKPKSNSRARDGGAAVTYSTAGINGVTRQYPDIGAYEYDSDFVQYGDVHDFQILPDGSVLVVSTRDTSDGDIWSFVYEAGTGGITLTLSDLQSSGIIDALALTQNNILSLNNLSATGQIESIDLITAIELILNDLQSQAVITGIDLTQNHILIVDDLQSNGQITTAILTQKHVLIVGNLESVSTIQNTLLTQHNNIVVNDLASSGVINTTNLTQSNLITINNLISSGIIETTDLVQSNLLSIDDLISSGLISTADLVQANVLSIDDLISSGLIETVDLLQGTFLSVNDLISSGLISTADLVQANVLSIDDLESAGLIDTTNLTQNHILVIDNLQSSGTISTVTVSLSQVLEVANLISNGTITVSDLEQHNILNLDSIISQAVIDTINLTQHNIITVSDLESQGNIENIDLSVAITLLVNSLQSLAEIQVVELSQNPMLTVQSLSSAAIIENLGLTQAHILNIADILSAAHIRNVNLSTTKMGFINLVFEDLYSPISFSDDYEDPIRFEVYNG
jgi:hypothetical protein